MNNAHSTIQFVENGLPEWKLALGKALIAKKKELPYGEWNAWCEANLEFSRATIHRYISFCNEDVSPLRHLEPQPETLTQPTLLRESDAQTHELYVDNSHPRLWLQQSRYGWTE